MASADIGLIGLAVMGQNLVLNMADHGFKVAVYNRTSATTKHFAEKHPDTVMGFYTLETFVAALSHPRKIMMMVKAGEAVDALIAQLMPFLEEGDILIDGGNSLYSDTTRRTQQLSEKGILYIGMGISGGEEGARHGPSIMPGGNRAAWESVKTVFQAISAKVNGEPCCDWVGEAGAGHYVKMIHNGIEYGDMQLIAEAYTVMREGLGMSAMECHEVFARWNEGVLDSYLIEITADILTVADRDGAPLVDKILDAAGQKGTGMWTAINALESGIPLSLITESVYARCLSSLVEERAAASDRYPKSATAVLTDREQTLAALHDALYASKIISYTQGYMLIREAAQRYGWQLNYGGIAMMWRGGCIIRSRFLGEIRRSFDQNPQLPSLLQDGFFEAAIKEAESHWRDTLTFAIAQQIPVPAMSAALAFFDGYRTKRGSAAMIQAQRDYFGAHTYERIDALRGETFHTDWIGGAR